MPTTSPDPSPDDRAAPAPLDPSDVEACLRVLRQLREDPGLAAGQVGLMALVAQVYKRERRERRRANGSARKARDRQLSREAAARLQQSRLANPDDVVGELPGVAPVDLEFGTRSCYGCRERFRRFDARYPWFCPDCSARNLQRRERDIDLRGRVVLVTGGRVKIGFQTALMALRGGAIVHVTSRFPKDTLRRFALERDFGDWRDRFFVHGLDFRDLRGVLTWCESLPQVAPELDVLVNNAAQSVKRSARWHERLQAFERDARLDAALAGRICFQHDDGGMPQLAAAPGEGAVTELSELVRSDLVDPDDREDRREENSWTAKLAEVSPVEFLEVLLVNANAPALLIARLRPLLEASPRPDRFIVNVTGTDGLLSLNKSGNHPHVNMSKAALNMVTRTCAQEFAADAIYMNSVDTGWVTHEGGFTTRQRGGQMGFVPPLDAVDAAARILDPVVEGITAGATPRSGCLFRNFTATDW